MASARGIQNFVYGFIVAFIAYLLVTAAPEIVNWLGL